MIRVSIIKNKKINLCVEKITWMHTNEQIVWFFPIKEKLVFGLTESLD